MFPCRECGQWECECKERRRNSVDRQLKANAVCLHPLATRPVFYTDSLAGKQVMRDDLWAVTTEELNTNLAEREELVTHLEWAMRFVEASGEAHPSDISMVKKALSKATPQSKEK